MPLQRTLIRSMNGNNSEALPGAEDASETSGMQNQRADFTRAVQATHLRILVRGSGQKTGNQDVADPRRYVDGHQDIDPSNFSLVQIAG